MTKLGSDVIKTF